MRPLTADEHAVLARALRSLGEGALEALLREDGAELWMGPEGLVNLLGGELAGALREGSWAPDRAGLPFGTLREGRFELGLEGASELSRFSTGAWVKLKPKAVQLFLYGRDVLLEGIQARDGRLQPGDLAILTNGYGETLGIARVVQFTRPGVALRPVIDRGWYLREGG